MVVLEVNNKFTEMINIEIKIVHCQSIPWLGAHKIIQ